MKKPTPIGIGEIKNAQKRRGRPPKISNTPRMINTEEDTAQFLSNLTISEETNEILLQEIEDSIEDTNLDLSTDEENQEEGQLSVDIFQNEKQIVIIAPIAGSNKNTINISLTDDVLTIEGKREKPFKATLDQYFTQECFWGKFSRSIVLPTFIDKNSIKASIKNSILLIKIDKKDDKGTKIIKIS